MDPVYEVTEIKTSWEKSKPPSFVVVAHGTTRTGGYTNPVLYRRVYLLPPQDGIQDYDFMATAPSHPSNSVITPIEATDSWFDPPKWVKGARVHAETNKKESK